MIKISVRADFVVPAVDLNSGCEPIQHCSVSKQEAPHESLECPALLRQGPVLYVLLVRLRDRKPELPAAAYISPGRALRPFFFGGSAERLMLVLFVKLSIWASSAVGFRALLHCHVK